MGKVSETRFENLKGRVGDIIDAGGERAHDLRVGAKAQIDKLGKLIEDHPFAAVGIAFGVGYIGMRLLRR